jgi:hypothetical protein
MARHHKRHHRRNPRGGSILFTIGGAAGGFLAVNASPSIMPSATGIMKYALQGGVAFLGSYALKRFLNRNAGFGFLVGGGAAIALELYQDYTSGALSSGTSFYAAQNFPVPYATNPGSPFLNPYAGAYPGGTSTLPVGTSAASASMVSTTGGKFSGRLKGRFS